MSCSAREKLPSCALSRHLDERVRVVLVSPRLALDKNCRASQSSSVASLALQLLFIAGSLISSLKLLVYVTACARLASPAAAEISFAT